MSHPKYLSGSRCSPAASIVSLNHLHVPWKSVRADPRQPNPFCALNKISSLPVNSGYTIWKQLHTITYKSIIYFVNRFQTWLIIMHVVVQFPTFHIEHINENFNIPENVILLRSKILLHERFLATTIPEIQHQVSQEAHMGVLNVDYSIKKKQYAINHTFMLWISINTLLVAPNRRVSRAM